MEREYHIACAKGEIGRYCILPGDPGRVPKIAAYLDGAVKVAENREFVTYTGTLLGEKVTVTSTGIGGPSAAIAVEELVHCGADTFIRVGTSGGMNSKVSGGDIVIATGAVRVDGTSREYMPIEFPAVADFDIVTALHDEAVSAGRRFHTGIVQSKDSFYGQHSPDTMPTAELLEYRWNAWIKGGCLCSEMEGAAIFIAAACRGVRAGMVLQVVWNQETGAVNMREKHEVDTEAAIKTAIGAVKRLIVHDRNEVK